MQPRLKTTFSLVHLRHVLGRAHLSYSNKPSRYSAEQKTILSLKKPLAVFELNIIFPATIIILRNLPTIHTSLSGGRDLSPTPAFLDESLVLSCLAQVPRSQSSRVGREETKESTQRGTWLLHREMLWQVEIQS